MLDVQLLLKKHLNVVLDNSGTGLAFFIKVVGREEITNSTVGLSVRSLEVSEFHTTTTTQRDIETVKHIEVTRYSPCGSRWSVAEGIWASELIVLRFDANTNAMLLLQTSQRFRPLPDVISIVFCVGL